MDEWKIKNDNYTIVMLEYYMENHSENSRKNVHFVKSTDLKCIIDNLEKEENTYIFFDMKYINKVASRAFSFLKDNKILEKIVFFHLQNNSEVSDNLDADLHGTLEETGETQIIYFSDQAKNKFHEVNIEADYQQKRIAILKKYVNKEIGFLSSSGIYSNMFLNYKEMFEHPQDFQYIISELYYLIQSIKKEEKIDYLVATSKTSIILTAILSRRLNIPAIYHTNIGQKYAKRKFSNKAESQADIIHKKKRYLMIYDVICLGTETRILNGIINVCEGNLIGAAGLVCVQDLEMIRSLDKDSVLEKVRCLTTAKEMKLGYRIALTKQELEE